MLQQILRRCSASRVQQQQQQDGGGGGGGGGRSQQLSQHLAQTLHQEMKVCCDAACRYPSNYNAWSHRIWVLQHMARGNVKVRGRSFLGEAWRSSRTATCSPRSAGDAAAVTVV